MRKTILEKNDKLPYSLHDMKIKNIKIDKDNITFIFEDGYVENKEPYKQINGLIIIENVDYDFATIHLLSKNGDYGEFAGRKLDIKTFIKEFKNYKLEVVYELYGFNQVEYSGYLSLPENDDFIEYSMNIYYTGDIVYLTEE